MKITARFLSTIPVILMLGIFLLLPLNYGSITQSSIILMHISAALIFFFFLLQKYVSQDLSLIKIYIEKPLSLFLSIVVLTSFSTIYFFNTQQEAHKIITYLIIFVATLTLFQSGPRLKLLAYWIIACAALLALIGIARYLSAPLFKALWPRAEFSTFISRNGFHAYINGGLSLAIALLFCDIRFWNKILLGIALFFMITAAALSYDRGGWLGFVALILFIFLFAGYERLLRGRFWHAVLLLISLLWVIGLSFRLNEVMERVISALVLNPKNAFNMDYDTTLWTRISIWKSGLRLLGRHPLLGVGLGNFRLAYPAFREDIIYNMVGYAHQDYLQFSVETGILGLISLFYLSISFLKRVIAEVRFKGSSFLAGLKVGGLAGVFSIAFHGLYEFPLHIPAVASLFTLLCGILMALYLMGHEAIMVKPHIKTIRAAYLAGIVIVIFHILYLGRLFAADRDYNKGLLAMERFSFNEAEEPLKKALSYVPHNAEYAARLGELCAHRSRFKDARLYYQKNAIALYKKALLLNPYEGDLHIEAGIVNTRYGLMKKAKEEFEKAVLLDPNNAFYRAILTEYTVMRRD